MSGDKKIAGEIERKQTVMNTGKMVLKPMREDAKWKVEAESKMKERFPTDKEIEEFQAQLNAESIKQLAEAFKNSTVTSLNKKINYATFQKFLNENFPDNKPAESLVLAMFERFRPFRLEGIRDDTKVAPEKDMEVLDFIIAMNLLARIVYEKKLKLLFWICDDDGDGCMTPEDILDMLQRVKRVFASECSRVDLHSASLNHLVADKQSEMFFHFIMGKIDIQSQKKEIEQKKHSDDANKNQTKMREEGQQNDQEEKDSLITYKEFIQAIKSADKLYENILPRSLSFREVLKARKSELLYELSDSHADNFAMFRYELNSIFRKHHFIDEDRSIKTFMGRNPLSKVNGKQFKDLDQGSIMQYQDMFRPPGVVKISEQKYFPDRLNIREQNSLTKTQTQLKEEADNILFDTTENIQHLGATIDERKLKEIEYKKRTERNIWMTVPTNKLYIRNPDTLISQYELRAIQNREKEINDQFYDQKASNKPVSVKENQKGADNKDNQSVKGEKGAKKDDKGKQAQGKKSNKTKFANEDEVDENKNYEHHLKITLDVLNPSKNKEKVSQLYKDQLPHASKQLKKFVEETIKEMNSSNNSQDFNWVLAKKENWKNMVKSVQNLLPEEGRDTKQISKLRFQQFQQEEQDKMRKNQ